MYKVVGPSQVIDTQVGRVGRVGRVGSPARPIAQTHRYVRKVSSERDFIF